METGKEAGQTLSGWTVLTMISGFFNLGLFPALIYQSFGQSMYNVREHCEKIDPECVKANPKFYQSACECVVGGLEKYALFVEGELFIGVLTLSLFAALLLVVLWRKRGGTALYYASTYVTGFFLSLLFTKLIFMFYFAANMRLGI